MKKALFGFIYYKVLGWKTKVTTPDLDKYIICAAPHTSNWDLFIGKLFYGAIGRDTGFMMKKEWFFWPLGPIFRNMGGIPVWRSKKTSMTDNLAATARQLNHFLLCITPEGTRSANPEWKKGFYYIAQKAEIPILLFGVDYEKKLIRCSKTVIPNGDIDAQIREIKLYFKDFKGKKPENFALGEV